MLPDTRIAPVHETLETSDVPAPQRWCAKRPSSLQRTIWHPNTSFSHCQRTCYDSGHRLHHGNLLSIPEMTTSEPGLLLSVYNTEPIMLIMASPFSGYLSMILVPPVRHALCHLVLVSGNPKHAHQRGRPLQREIRRVGRIMRVFARAEVEVSPYHPVGVNIC
jgi:hypothetical protein